MAQALLTHGPSPRLRFRMSLARFIKQIAHPAEQAQDLSESEAQELFAAILDGGASELEIGAALVALRTKNEAMSELIGFHRAMKPRVHRLHVPRSALKPMVFASYGGAQRNANLLPLLVLLLQRTGIPTLLHGTMEGNGRVASAYILRELDILPCASLSQAQRALDEEGLAFVPTAVLCPAIAALLTLRNRLGVCNLSHTMVQFLNPFEVPSVITVSAADDTQLAAVAAFIAQMGIEALLLRSTEGESFADPHQRPRMLHITDGVAHTLFEDETIASRAMNLPATPDAATTALWIGRALAGSHPVPQPLVNQFACCLFLSRYTEDMNQAKAIAAVQTGALSPARARHSGRRVPVQ
jgi:anthranilate phosphoribosyltransferase